jgi:hypothetical protein
MKATITFTRCVQDSQDYGSDDEHMISRVFFDLDVDGRAYTALYVDIKQAVGSDYETGDIEVGMPTGYSGPFNYFAFRDAVERYYRGLVGSAGSGIRIQGGRDIRMRNSTFVSPGVEVFEIDASTSGCW